jgi:hypothetical protein
MESLPDQRLDVYEQTFTPLAILVARLAQDGTPPATVVAVTEHVIRQRASANAHERGAIMQYVRARR